MSPWCPKCGFYPKLNRVMEGVAVQETETDPMDELDLNQFFPPWAWTILIGVVVLIAESVAVRLLVNDLVSRNSFAQFQILVGLIAFILAHSKAYLIAAMASTKYTPGTAITQPLTIWSEVFKVLPKQKKVLMTAIWSATAIMLAVSVIGLDFEALFKSDPNKKVAKINPFKWIMKSVVSIASHQANLRAAQGGAAGAMGGMSNDLPANASLEDAIGSFADVAGADILNAAGAGGGGGGGGGAFGMVAGAAAGMDTGSLDFSGGGGGGGTPDGLTGAISGFADVSGAGELTEGQFNAETLTKGGVFTGGPGNPGITGPGTVSASFSTGGGAVSTGPYATSMGSGGVQTGPNGTKLIAPTVFTGTGETASQTGGTGGKPVPAATGGKTVLLGTTQPAGPLIPKGTEATGSPSPGSTSSGSQANSNAGQPGKKPERETMDVVIFGYTTNAGGEIRSLLVAKTTSDNRARFVGRLSLDDVSKQTVTALEAELEAIRTRNPAVACPYGGRWVRPIIHCEVAYDGWTADGRLNDGKLLSYKSE